VSDKRLTADRPSAEEPGGPAPAPARTRRSAGEGGRAGAGAAAPSQRPPEPRDNRKPTTRPTANPSGAGRQPARQGGQPAKTDTNPATRSRLIPAPQAQPSPPSQRGTALAVTLADAYERQTNSAPTTAERLQIMQEFRNLVWAVTITGLILAGMVLTAGVVVASMLIHHASTSALAIAAGAGTVTGAVANRLRKWFNGLRNNRRTQVAASDDEAV